MCGIIGYTGKQNACDIALKGLEKLEYRGYDSAGLSYFKDNKVITIKKAGKVEELKSFIRNNNKQIQSQTAIGHTRWATHGAVNDINAHPQVSKSKKFSIVHNGIIENYSELKKLLEKYDYKFESETDTEILINYIEYYYNHYKKPLHATILQALKKVEGQFAILIMCEDDPNSLYFAKKNAPLLIGIGDNEFYIASDLSAISEYTNKIIYLDDEVAGSISNNYITIYSLKNGKELKYNINEINLKHNTNNKGNYNFFMVKEIYEQPKIIQNIIQNNIDNNDNILISGLKQNIDKIINANKIIILGCGSSLNSGILAKYIIERICRIPVLVEQASEFRYRCPVISNLDVVIAISQSGETADVVNAVNYIQQFGNFVISLCNVPNSTITRLANFNIKTNAGIEIGVASTKAFSCQIINLLLFALEVYQRKNTLINKVIDINYKDIIKDLYLLSDNITNVLNQKNQIKEISHYIAKFNNIIFLGRNLSYPIAMEGALKLKEISYIHAEGYAASEMKHGPLALIDKNMPSIFIAGNSNFYKKNISSIKEIKARNGKIISIISAQESEILKESDFYIKIPITNDFLMPILSTIVVQMIACYTGIVRKCDIDKPKNLAKSVTVE